MTRVEIKQLYNYNRFTNNASNFILLLLYLPIGFLLVLLRFIILLITLLLSSVLPKTNFIHGILSKVLCIIFGISIQVENNEKKEDVDAYISNQISILDNFVVRFLTGCVTPGMSMETQFSSMLGVKYFGSLSNFETFKNSIALYLNENRVPLFLQPEAAITNGKALLKFKTWPFQLCSRVQPIVLDVQRPLFNISVSTIDSTYFTDMFFFMFSPLTVYKVQYLPSSERKGLSETDFSEKIQQDIARGLKVETTEHTSSDMLEWRKRYHMEQQRAQNNQIRSTPNSISMELQRMSMQVKEVLPMVPLSDILKDLAKTRNVDLTITNILDGSVPYVPEQIPPIPSTSTSTSRPVISDSCSVQKSSKDPFNTAANSFGKSPTERSMSFQERKQQLIENARRRYIEKHGLNIVALNNC